MLLRLLGTWKGFIRVMLQKENLEIKNEKVYDILSELKDSAENPAVTDEVNSLAALDDAKEPFDAAEYDKSLDDYPSLAYLHLVTPSDEQN